MYKEKCSFNRVFIKMLALVMVFSLAVAMIAGCGQGGEGVNGDGAVPGGGTGEGL